MSKTTGNKIVVSKKGKTFILSDRKTGKSLYHVVDTPIYEAFDLDTPFLSGMGSAFNVSGNYYSFRKYLARNNDYQAIASDWKKVGIYLIEALSLFNHK